MNIVVTDVHRAPYNYTVLAKSRFFFFYIMSDNVLSQKMPTWQDVYLANEFDVFI